MRKGNIAIDYTVKLLIALFILAVLIVMFYYFKDKLFELFNYFKEMLKFT